MQASVLFKTTVRNLILRFNVCPECILSVSPTPSSSDEAHFQDQVQDGFILTKWQFKKKEEKQNLTNFVGYTNGGRVSHDGENCAMIHRQ